MGPAALRARSSHIRAVPWDVAGQITKMELQLQALISFCHSITQTYKHTFTHIQTQTHQGLAHYVPALPDLDSSTPGASIPQQPTRDRH